MAVAKMGGIITALKGKIGGTCFQTGRVGQIVKNISAPYNPAGKITKADAGRALDATISAMAESSRVWKGLSPGQVNGWNAFAPNWPFYNRYGVSYVGSGFQVFTQINMRLYWIAQTLIQDPPILVPLANAPSFTVTYDSTSHSLNVQSFTMATGWTYTLFCTRGLSKGRMPRPGDYVALYCFDPGDTFPFTLANYYSDIYGPVPSQANLWFRLDCTNNITGQRGSSSFFQLIY